MSHDQAQELIRLRRILWSLFAGMVIATGVGAVALWKAHSVQSQLNRFRIQTAKEFATLARNPEAYFADIQRLDSSIKEAVQQVRDKKATKVGEK